MENVRGMRGRLKVVAVTAWELGVKKNTENEKGFVVCRKFSDDITKENKKKNMTSMMILLVKTIIII